MELVPAENFCATLSVNVDNDKLTDANFREFVRNTLPIVEYKRPKPSLIENNKPPVPTEPQKCKFCDFEWPGGEDHACQSGSFTDDDGTLYIDYCGHQECPMCFFCQGNKATPDMIRSAKVGRAIKEGKNEDGL